MMICTLSSVLYRWRMCFLLLGDFNAHVGSRIHSVDYDREQRVDGMAGEKFTWASALGPFGLGSCNQAVEDVLLF